MLHEKCQNFHVVDAFYHMVLRFLLKKFLFCFSLQKVQSTETELLLRSVDLDTTGLYRCEISGEAPLFQTAVKEAVLAVVGTSFYHFDNIS